MEEHFFQCPYCWEGISVLLDPSVAKQYLVEDCEVCCNPIEINATFQSLSLMHFDAGNLGQ